MNTNLVQTWMGRLLHLSVVSILLLMSTVSAVSATSPVDRAFSLTNSLEAANQLNEQIILLVIGGLLIAAGGLIILSSTTAYIVLSRKVEAMIQ